MRKRVLSKRSNFPKYAPTAHTNPKSIGDRHVVGERSPPQLGKRAYLGAVKFVAVFGALRPESRRSVPILECPARHPADADPRRHRSAGDAAVAAAPDAGGCRFGRQE